MAATLSFLIFSLIYSIALNLLFFNKKHINTYETKVFGKLLITNFFGIIIELVCVYFLNKFGSESIYTYISAKGILLYLLTFLFFFNLYIFMAMYNTSEDSKIEKHYKKVEKFNFLFYILSIILMVVLPLNIYNKGGVAYSFGMSANVVFIVSGLCALLCIIAMLKNIKNLRTKKYLPLISFVIGGTLVMLVQRENPALTLATSMETFLVFLMYHTIENPDVRMVEELTKSKDLNDKVNSDKSNIIMKITESIRNPISEINKISEYALNQNPKEEVKYAVKDIKKISGNLYDLVNQTLDISNVDSKNLKITDHEYNVINLLNEIVLQNEKKVGPTVELRHNFTDTIPSRLNGDAVKLKQVLNTVLLNAIKHTEKGFIEFNVDALIKYDVCRLIFTIEDSGSGMDMKKVSELLESKEELTEEEIKKLDTMDLNLNIVNKLLHAIGGTITIKSDLKQGTKVTIVLDQKIGKESEDKEIKQMYEYGNREFNKKKVLLISEDENITKLFKKLVMGLDINLITITSGKECLDKVRAGEYIDLIYTCEDLSKIDAHNLLKKLKLEENFSKNIILISGEENPNKISSYLDEGFARIINTSLNKQDVVEPINKILK